MEKKIESVAVLGTFEVVQNRGILKGILKYHNEHENLLFWRTEPFNWYDKVASNRVWKKLLNAHPDGIISLTGKPPLAVLEQKIPLVDASGYEYFDNIPKVAGDNSTVGKMGAEYFLNMGFEHFAYCGYSGIKWSTERYQAFHEVIANNGFGVILNNQDHKLSMQSPNDIKLVLAGWLAQLPKPIAIMTCEDCLSELLLDACLLTSIKVPDEVAILGVDDDIFMCQNTKPNLSSIRVDYEKAGYEVAVAIKELIDKKNVDRNINIQAVCVVPRESTDILRVTDRDVFEAINFICEHADKSIQVNDVVNKIAISRSALEKKFLKVRKHSIFEEIRYYRINLIKKMLLETDMHVYQIGEKLGFNGANGITYYFKRSTGITPSEFIKLYRKNS